MTTQLAKQTQKTAGIPNGMRTATITAVSSTAITISVSGGQFTAGVGVVTSYVPIVGDTVAVFRQDSSWLILGKTSAANRWQRMANFGYLNGWTDRNNGIAPVGQFRIVGDSVQIVGGLTVPGTFAAAILPAGSMPAPTAEAIMLGTINTNSVRLIVSQAGAFTCFDNGGTGFLQFVCTYPLDPLSA